MTPRAGSPRHAPARHGLHAGEVALLAALALAALVLILSSCARGPAIPAPLEPGAETCGSCRMVVSDPRLAAQIVAPGEETVFFDDIRCLAAYLDLSKTIPEGAVAFVADHRTGAWVPASRAIYTRVPGLVTPMLSGLVAHADASTRDADPDGAGGEPVERARIFGPKGPPGP